MNKFRYTPNIKEDLIVLRKEITGKYSLKEVLNKININNYYILKYTKTQKEITYNELLKEEYAGYILFNKNKTKLDHIFLWCNNYEILYLVKQIPPFNPNNKIIVR